MVDVITMGETMALFTPDSTGLMRYAHTFTRKFGGAESNVAIGLARLGHRSGWITRVGDDELGKAMLSFVRGEGVDVRFARIDREAPTGIYFKELRREGDVRIQYYRKDSAASRLSPADIDEAYVSQARFVHISGITPALSESCHEAVFKLIEVAKKHQIPIVFDPNLRKKLWSETKAREVLLAIAAQADIVLPGVEEGAFLFNERDPDKLGKRFIELGAKLVVIKVGAEGAYYVDENECVHVPGYRVERVIDPVGAGDGFASGFMSGLLDNLSIEAAVQRGNAVGAMVTMVNGDVEGLPGKEDLTRFIAAPAEDVSR
ncbi:sugar kinase [Halalkalibacterium ligniniphilum]|uniref:sugar kinase n=1 Tax=Halalkalibacterium ligniniphilum TaxID=1134413 RepID=UPI000345E64B|nr:sugar kinase [Halalkalibacterium ligniniphilum]